MRLLFFSSFERICDEKPIDCLPVRDSMIASSPSKAPPQMNRMLRGIDLDKLLMRMLAAALRRDVGDRALQNLQQRLLHALAG